MPAPRLNTAALYELLDAQRQTRGLSWTALAAELDITKCVFTRMAGGGAPDGHTVLALLGWLEEPGEFEQAARLTGRLLSDAQRLTDGQVQRLLDRALQHKILPGEVEQLRTEWERRSRVLVAAERAVADGRRLRRERNEALLDLTTVGAWSVVCEWCGAEPGQRCIARRGAFVPRVPHRLRRLAWEAQAAEVAA